MDKTPSVADQRGQAIQEASFVSLPFARHSARRDDRKHHGTISLPVVTAREPWIEVKEGEVGTSAETALVDRSSRQSTSVWVDIGLDSDIVSHLVHLSLLSPLNGSTYPITAIIPTGSCACRCDQRIAVTSPIQSINNPIILCPAETSTSWRSFADAI